MSVSSGYSFRSRFSARLIGLRARGTGWLGVVQRRDMSDAPVIDLQAPTRSPMPQGIWRRYDTASCDKETWAGVVLVRFERESLHPIFERDGSSGIVRRHIGMRETQKVTEKAIEVALESDGHLPRSR